MTVYPEGLTESLSLMVAAGCGCECETRLEENAAFCSGSGDLQCGQCSCRPGYSGERCQCRGEAAGAGAVCSPAQPGLQCSGRGRCVCGVCQCESDPRGTVSGNQCECEDWTCPLDSAGQLCGGLTNG